MAVVPLVAGAGRLAMQALPYLTAATGFTEGAKEGGLMGGLLGAGAGYGLGRFGLGKLGAPMAATAKAAPGLASLAGIKGTPLAAKQIGAALVPLAASAVAPVAGRMAGGLVGGLTGAATGAVGNLGQSAAGIIGYTADGKPVYGGAALPPGMGQYGPTDPYGSPTDVLGPAGMGQRLQTLKDAQTQRDVLRTLLPEIEAASEARSKKEFERQMAGAGIRQNIQTRAAMQQAAQTAGLQAGLGALQQAGGALTRQYQYQ